MTNNKNIIVIITDDQGAWAMGCAGNGEIRTPNLDRLAQTGTLMDNFFCVSPVCSPARASILTGRIPSQHGVHDWLAGGNSATVEKRKAIEYLSGMLGYTDLLAANGYTCGLSGKWHMGDSEHPQKSFSFWQAHCLGGGPYYDAPFSDASGKVTYRKGEYVTEVTTGYAIEFLNGHRDADSPFCLNVCYTAPHRPWDKSEHPQETYEGYYDNCSFESVPDTPRHPWQKGPYPESRRADLAGYFAAITEMDKGVGEILDWLEDSGHREDTLVIFTSDNGMNMGHHGIYGKGNGTFPVNMYDTSVKVPFLISQPGTIPEGQVNTDLLSHYDVFPTLCDYSGTTNTEAKKLPGSSFLPALKGEGSARNGEIVVFDEYGPVRMIRNHNYKYVHRYPYGSHEFYDLRADPEESVNLINEDTHRDTVVAMKATLDRWFDRYVDPSLDGAHEPVSGGGQFALAGPAGGGKPAFSGRFREEDRVRQPTLLVTPW